MLKHDPELEEAKWVPVEEVREALRIATFTLDEAARKGEEDKEGGDRGGGRGESKGEGSLLRLPPSTAIANQLLSAVVGGFLSLSSLPEDAPKI